MLEEINVGLTAAESTLGILDKILIRTEKYKQIKKDTTTFLRLLYLEVLDNIELLNTLDFRRYQHLKPNHPFVKAITQLLKTEVAEAVFYKEEETPNTDLFEKLRKQGQVKNRENKLVRTEQGVDKSVKGRFIYENILQAVSFVVVKLHFLKRLALLDDDDIDMLKPLKLDARLINVYQRLLMIKSIMDKMPEIKEMAR